MRLISRARQLLMRPSAARVGTRKEIACSYQPPTGNLPQPNVPPPIPLVNFRPPSRMPWVLTAAVVAVAGFGAYWGLGERARLTAKAQEAKSAVRAAVAAGQSLEKQLSELQSERRPWRPTKRP